MSKKTIKLLFAALLVVVMVMPHEAVAKKVTYLGHYYNGKLNKNKVPEGKGEMNVGGLVITGVFDDRVVTDAVVRIMDEIEGPHNCRFCGTVNYDESEYITLNAGGLFFTRYYNNRWGSETVISNSDLMNDKNELIDTLKENRIVKAYGFSFEKNIIEVPFYYDLDDRNLGFKSYYGDILSDDMLKLDPPTGKIKTYCTMKLKKVKVRNFNNTYGNETNVFSLNNDGRFEIRSIDGYKDSKGRLWSLRLNSEGKIESFSVRYPNGDVFSTEEKWEIHYPNGQIIRWNSNYIDMGKGMYLKAKIGDFFDLRGKDKFYPTKAYDYCIYDNSFEKTTPPSEVEKIIKEKLGPYFDINSTRFWVCYKEKNPYIDYYSIEQYGHFDDGKCSSDYESHIAEEEAEKKIEKVAYTNISKKYGKKYADAFKENRIIIGMPEEVLRAFQPWRLISETGSSRKYRIGNMIVYVYNGKVEKIVY